MIRGDLDPSREIGYGVLHGKYGLPPPPRLFADHTPHNPQPPQKRKSAKGESAKGESVQRKREEKDHAPYPHPSS